MEQFVVNAKIRKEAGKRVSKQLRAEGRIPAIAYNEKGESIMLDVDAAEFSKAWRSITPTTLINLKIDGQDNMAYIQDTEYDIKTDKNLHADFHIVSGTKNWDGWTRTSGMTAPKAVVLPLDDVPKYMWTKNLFFRRTSFYMSRIIFFKNFGLNRIAKVRADWMSNILVLTICSLTAWHCNKKTRRSFDNLYIMNNKAVVKCNSNISL